MTDYMKEAERLADEYANAVHDGRDGDCVAFRADLLAHIQRGAAPDGWQVVPIDPSPGMLDAAEAVDWGDEDTRGSCCNQWHAMLAAAPAPDQFRDAAKMMAEPAEVPMPEPDSECTHTDDHLYPVWREDQIRTYGAACRAAGEAAGYARGRAEAERDAERLKPSVLEIEELRLYARALCKAVDAATDFIGTVAGGASWWDDVWADHAAALDRARERISQAALRGEVKP